MSRNRVFWLALLAVFGLIAAACGSDDDGGDTTAAEAPAEEAPAEEAPAEEAPAEEAPAEEAPAEEAPAEEVEEPEVKADPLDVNGDGQVVIGIAAAGDANDGAYYQAIVDGATEFSNGAGWGTPIVIDKIDPSTAATDLANLAEQGVDIIAVGSGEISDPLPDLTEQYSDIFWYCRCDSNFPDLPGLAQSADDSTSIEYIAGFATGLLLEERGGDSVYMLGGSGADFEVETELAFRMGLEMVSPDYTITYVATGAQPFDFDNVAGATEAFNVAVDAGADAVYPYLGGAHEPIVQLANEAGIITMSAGASDVCTRDSDLNWQIAIKFDGGDYVRAVFPLIDAGTVQEGDRYIFSVEPGSVAGAEICDPTPEQQERLDAEVALVASGTYNDRFNVIRGEAYGG